MNAYELADIQAFKTEELTMWERNTTATMLRQQADRISVLEDDGRVLMQHIADMNEEKNKLRYQKSYLIQLEQALESSIKLNKAQAERNQ
jgi:hypothetical protein